MRFLLAHPGASWATHDVHTGLLAGLKAGGHDVVEYALDGRISTSSVFLTWLWRRHVRSGGPLADVRPTPADVQYHAGKDLLERALRFEVDWVLVVCAAYLHPDVLILARRAGLRLAAVFTESPYDDAQQAKVAPLFDACFTNERTSLPVLRAANPETHYLPVGYDPAAHGRPLHGGGPSPHRDSNPEPPDAPARCSAAELWGNGPPQGSVRAHDVVFVGTAVPGYGFEPRLELLASVDWSGIDLGLYGWWEGLDAGHPLRPYVREGLVDNARVGSLYRHARIGLNLFRHKEGTRAESLNPRAYELAADGVFTLSQPRAEVAERFGPSVPTFKTAHELQTLLRHFLRHDRAREETAARLPSAVAEDTYHHRAAELVGRLAI